MKNVRNNQATILVLNWVNCTEFFIFPCEYRENKISGNMDFGHVTEVSILSASWTYGLIAQLVRATE